MENYKNFSNAIIRMSGKTNLIDLAGLLTAEEVDIVEKNIKQARKEYNKRVDRIKKLVVESY